MSAIGSITGGIQAEISAESEASSMERVAEQKYDWAMEEIAGQRRQIGLRHEQIAETVGKVRRQGSREASGLLAVSGARGVSRHGASFKVLKEDIKDRYGAEIRGLDRQRKAMHEAEAVLDIREGQAEMEWDYNKMQAVKTRVGGKAALHSGIMGAIGGIMESVTSGITGGIASGGFSPGAFGGGGASVPSGGSSYGGSALMPTTQQGAFGGAYGGDPYRSNFIAW